MMVLFSTLQAKATPYWRPMSLKLLLIMLFLSWDVVIIGILIMAEFKRLLLRVVEVIIRLKVRNLRNLKSVKLRVPLLILSIGTAWSWVNFLFTRYLRP